MIDVEAYIVFLAACFFTLVYLSTKASGKPANWLGIFAGTAWMVMGLLWIPLAYTATSYGTYAIALFFNAIGIFMFVYVIIDILNIGKTNPRELGETETE